MKDGILIIDKPEGITSAKIVLKIKKVLNLNKAGHTGTLDPFATGVLVLCLNSCTKKAPYFFSMDKTYSGTMILGISTDTQDLTGRVVRVCTKRRPKFNLDEVKSVFRKFQGEIWQTPPMFSAIKSRGKPLYQLARKGIEIEIAPRKIQIFQLTVLDLKWDKYPSIGFEVKCSKGTYIRTLCSDIGEYLGCGAYLSKLRRIQVGKISINQSIPLDRFMEMPSEKQKQYILPCRAVLDQISQREKTQNLT